MRRLLAALVLLALLAVPALGKVLIVERRHGESDVAGRTEAENQGMRNIRLLKSILNRSGMREGVDYVVVRSQSNGASSGIGTEDCRTGLVVWGRGTSSAHAEQFDGVIYFDWAKAWSGDGSGSSSNAYFRPESLTLAARTSGSGGLLVPQMAMLTNSWLMSTDFADIVDATSDTLGIQYWQNGNGGDLSNLVGTDLVWRNTAYCAGYVGETAPAGGVRSIIRSGQSIYQRRHTEGNLPMNSAWPDSFGEWSTTADSMLLWDRQMSHISGSKTLTVSDCWGAGAMGDSLYNNFVSGYHKPPTEGDYALILASLAHFDSLCGQGTVLGPKKFQLAIVVDRALSRGNRMGPHGPFVDDETAYYAFLDSLKALGVPLTFAVPMDPDTLTAYSVELAKLKAMPRAHFTPQTWTGLDSTVAFTDEDGNASWSRPVDVLGRWRNRAIYYADSVHTGGGADTTLYALLASSFWHADSIFGRARVSRFLCAPEDDWSPLGVTGRNRTSVVDSIAWVCQKLGIRGIRVNGQQPECNANYTRGPAATNPRGYYNEQRRWSGSLSSTQKWDINLIAHNSCSIQGGTWQQIPMSITAESVYDTTGYSSSTTWWEDLAPIKAWIGMTQDYDMPYDCLRYDGFGATVYDVYMPLSDKFGPQRRAGILTIHSGDLSGATDGTNGAPAAPGYWAIKSIVNAARAINYLAGRQIVEFVYPEEVRP